jgi:hypothetical protein
VVQAVHGHLAAGPHPVGLRLAHAALQDLDVPARCNGNRGEPCTKRRVRTIGRFRDRRHTGHSYQEATINSNQRRTAGTEHILARHHTFHPQHLHITHLGILSPGWWCGRYSCVSQATLSARAALSSPYGSVGEMFHTSATLRRKMTCSR